jgi:hypothetical protein
VDTSNTPMPVSCLFSTLQVLEHHIHTFVGLRPQLVSSSSDLLIKLAVS